MTSPSIEHLRYFIIVVEKGSFTAAARYLKRDRSSIGQAVSNLEIDLGFELFERNGRQLLLKPEGQALYNKARTLLHNYQSFCQFSTDLSAGLESEIVVGVDYFVSNSEIANLHHLITQQFPNLSVHWRQHSTFELDNLLDNGDVDINIRLFQNNNISDEYHLAHIDNLELVPLINVNALPQKSGLVKHQDLRSTPLISFPGMDSVFRNDRFEKTHRVFSRECALQIVRTKESWTLGTLEEAFLYQQELSPIHLDTNHPFTLRRLLIWRHNQTMGKAKLWLIKNIPLILSKSAKS